MGHTSAALEIAKEEFQNNTAGYIGVVKINHKGDAEGVSVKPHGRVWLSEQEKILTARAPEDPANNPFASREYIVIDPETQRRVSIKIRPLTLVAEDERGAVDSDRFIPGVTQDPEASGIAPRPQPQPQAVAPGSPVPSSPRVVPGAPPMASDDEEEAKESWTEQEAPGEVLPGRLSGGAALSQQTNEPEREPGEEIPQRPVLQPPVSQTRAPVEEEHASAVDPKIGEETGAATPPNQPAPEGEYASFEEVGTPVPSDSSPGVN